MTLHTFFERESCVIRAEINDGRTRHAGSITRLRNFFIFDTVIGLTTPHSAGAKQRLEVPGCSLDTKKLLIVCVTLFVCSAFIGAGLVGSVEALEKVGGTLFLLVVVSIVFSPFTISIIRAMRGDPADPTGE